MSDARLPEDPIIDGRRPIRDLLEADEQGRFDCGKFEDLIQNAEARLKAVLAGDDLRFTDSASNLRMLALSGLAELSKDGPAETKRKACVDLLRECRDERKRQAFGLSSDLGAMEWNEGMIERCNKVLNQYGETVL